MTTNASKPDTPNDEPEQRSGPPQPATAADEVADDATRTAQILRLAEQEAAALRAQASEDAATIRDQAQREADAARAQAERDAADARLAALAEADSIREQAVTESAARHAELEREADELVVSVWWLAERIRAAAGKDPRELPRITDEAGDTHDTDGADGGEATADVGASKHASEAALARHSALRRAAVAAQQSKRTTDAAQEESERVLARARREAEELINRARGEAERLVKNAESAGEEAADLAQRRVDALNRERDGILTSLAELMQNAAGLGLHQPDPTATGKAGEDGAARRSPTSGPDS
jgi:hypothetical protein